MPRRRASSLALVLTLLAPACLRAEDPYPLAEAFAAEVARIEDRPLAGIGSAEEWNAQRPELQRQLREMLGLDPLPEKTDLKVVVTGTVERPDFVVEKLHFQSIPGLYVTANLYRPKQVDGKLPGILYVCGHAKVEKDGVIYGNKTHYQHHAAWYAANGFVCLVVDTLQLGEVPGVHHGTYNLGRYWWQGRGYTPAGVEAWNGIRALDYLASRPEVDPERLGVTGRSGGGATSWWLGALDDRLKAVVPVAGITDLRNHLIRGGVDGGYPNGCIDGHCDCMFFLNTYRWDFDTLAALVAPKALLVENTNRDPIFPIDGVRRVYSRVGEVYDWYDEPGKLDLVVGKGGHEDTVELRHPSFAFMKKWLAGEDVAVADIQEPDRKIPAEELKVLPAGEPLPADQINDRVDEVFVARAGEVPVPANAEEWEALKARWLERARATAFAGWPGEGEGRDDQELEASRMGFGPTLLGWYNFESQPGVVCTLGTQGDHDPVQWVALTPWFVQPKPFPGVDPNGALPDGTQRKGVCRVTLNVRGQPPTETGKPSFMSHSPQWPAELDSSLRRRFALIGQTLDGQRVWDVRCGIQALERIGRLKDAPIELVADETTAHLALWAAVFEPEVESLTIYGDLPADFPDRPAFLGLDRVLTNAQALALLYPRPVILPAGTDPARWAWAFELGKKLDPSKPWPTIAEPKGDR
jgi:acetyl esterase/lipase